MKSIIWRSGRLKKNKHLQDENLFYCYLLIHKMGVFTLLKKALLINLIFSIILSITIFAQNSKVSITNLERNGNLIAVEGIVNTEIDNKISMTVLKKGSDVSDSSNYYVVKETVGDELGNYTIEFKMPEKETMYLQMVITHYLLKVRG
jgi:hypothetical protein